MRRKATFSPRNRNINPGSGMFTSLLVYRHFPLRTVQELTDISHRNEQKVTDLSLPESENQACFTRGFNHRRSPPVSILGTGIAHPTISTLRRERKKDSTLRRVVNTDQHPGVYRLDAALLTFTLTQRCSPTSSSRTFRNDRMVHGRDRTMRRAP